GHRVICSAVEALSYELSNMGRNPGPTVRDRQYNLTTHSLARQRDAATGRRELDGIVEKVRKRLEDQIAIALYRQPLLHLNGQSQRALLNGWLVEFDHISYDGREIDRFAFDRMTPALDAGNAKNGIEHPDHQLGFFD